MTRVELQETEHDDVDGANQSVGSGNGRRPQTLVFAFFGGVIHGRDLPPIPTAVFLRLFGSLGVAPAAARATLARMTRRGLLERVRIGRAAHYRLSPVGDAIVRKAAQRVEAPAPFEHPDGQWTLLSYSMPETRRDLRHRMRAALTWAGFGGLRDGLWIAPGLVDVGEVFAEAGLTEAAGLADWFAAQPLPGVQVEDFIRRAWPVDRIREEHDRFIQKWWTWSDEEDPLAQLTLLGSDWLRVLQADPGLPARFLAPDWPAAQSTSVYRRCHQALLPAAERRLDVELGLATVD
ncbi:PaaX family transcriptional regulator [Cryptosporangium minutisporangium]|uniref:PaaX family transcriptional regulator C-terminal domain-containing protein n=1 Tax=Cryptosporangium minutisporangium TaxID=113569 RepID=A0ABP6STU5_9ACTN